MEQKLMGEQEELTQMKEGQRRWRTEMMGEEKQKLGLDEEELKKKRWQQQMKQQRMEQEEWQGEEEQLWRQGKAREE